MKIKVYSQTGKPTDAKAAKKYQDEFRDKYDELWEKKTNGKINIDEFKAELAEFESELKSRYPMFLQIDMPKSGKAWKELIMAFECPVTLAITEEDHKLALFLMDSGY